MLHLLLSTASATRPRPALFSWNTLPVFFHSANASGPWSPAAAEAVAKYPMATNEKNHGMRLPNGDTRSEEVAGPEACRQVRALSPHTDAFFYLNSVIDWSRRLPPPPARRPPAHTPQARTRGCTS